MAALSALTLAAVAVEKANTSLKYVVGMNPRSAITGMEVVTPRHSLPQLHFAVKHEQALHITMLTCAHASTPQESQEARVVFAPALLVNASHLIPELRGGVSGSCSFWAKLPSPALAGALYRTPRPTYHTICLQRPRKLYRPCRGCGSDTS